MRSQADRDAQKFVSGLDRESMVLNTVTSFFSIFTG